MTPVLVCVAYLGAFVLHYGFPNPAAPGPDPYKEIPAMLSASLALVLLIKMSPGAAVFQAYRGMWRYLGLSDLMTLAKVTLLASAILIIGLPIVVRGAIIPRSVLVIDFPAVHVLAARLAGAVRGAQRCQRSGCRVAGSRAC